MNPIKKRKYLNWSLVFLILATIFFSVAIQSKDPKPTSPGKGYFQKDFEIEFDSYYIQEVGRKINFLVIDGHYYQILKNTNELKHMDFCECFLSYPYLEPGRIKGF